MTGCRVLLLVVALGVSCAGVRTPGHRVDCPVDPVARGDLPQDVSLRARMRIRAGAHEASFQVVAQATPEALIIVGIAPYGTRLFELRQRDGQFFVDPALPVEARTLSIYSADALHRAYWIRPPGEATSWDRAGEHISESVQQGDRRRVYQRNDRGAGSQPITIDYHEPGFEGTQGAEIDNPWCGYRAVIVLLDVNEKDQAP